VNLVDVESARRWAQMAGTPVRDRAPAPPELAERFWSQAIERFEAAADGRLLERDLVIADLPVRLSFAGSAMYEAVFPAFEHLARPTRLEPARRVLIWDTASTAVGPPDQIWGETDVGPHGEVLPLGQGPIHAAADGWGRLLAYDSRSGTLVFHAPDVALFPWHEHAAPMRSGLHWLLTGPERHLIHGAAVGERGRGLLITAPSGSGKSTLAAACFCAGLDVAADDFVAVTLDGAPRAHSLYATAKLDRRSVELLDPDPSLITNPDFAEDEKAVLDLRSGPIVTELPIDGIVVPRLTGASTPVLERIGAAETLRQIGPSSLVVMPRPRGPALATAAELARRLPAWRLDVGEDLQAAVDALRGLLAAEVAA
jgi:hypothetical protein